jgi:hypothetical protein
MNKKYVLLVFVVAVISITIFIATKNEGLNELDKRDVFSEKPISKTIDPNLDTFDFKNIEAVKDISDNLELYSIEYLRDFYSKLYLEIDVSLIEIAELVDESLMIRDTHIQYSAISFLYKKMTKNFDSVAEYMNEGKHRKELFINLLTSSSPVVREGTFSILFNTMASDPGVINSVAKALAEEDPLEKKIKMIRTLGVKVRVLPQVIIDQLVGMVLTHPAREPDYGTVVESIYVLSKSENNSVSKLFPHICKLYKESYYSSPTMLHALNNFREKSRLCIPEMTAVISQLNSGKISTQHKDWVITRTKGIIEQYN